MKIAFKLINWKTNGLEDDFERNLERLTNAYLLTFLSIFFFYSVFISIYFGDILVPISFISVVFFFIAIFQIKKKWERKSFIVFTNIFLISLISFLYQYTEKKAGVEYFYFSILFAMPFFFNIKKDIAYVSFIFLFILFSFITFLVCDFSFIPKSTFLNNENDFKIIKISVGSISLLTFIIGIYFLIEKDTIIHKVVSDNENQALEIDELIINNKLMKQQIIINNLSEENMTRINTLAEENSPFFFETFKSFFLNFESSILNLNRNLIDSELYLCALLKLNFDTKKIARITNTSVRAVESRKYRIRKKLDIAPGTNINAFFIKI